MEMESQELAYQTHIHTHTHHPHSCTHTPTHADDDDDDPLTPSGAPEDFPEDDEFADNPAPNAPGTVVKTALMHVGACMQSGPGSKWP